MSAKREEVDRTEPASPRWAAHAREHGPWPRSRPLITACTVLAGVLAIRAFAPSLATSLQSMLSTSLRHGIAFDNLANPVTSRGLYPWTFWHFVPLLLVPAATAALVGFVQAGFRFRFDRLCPSLDRFSVGTNLRPILCGTSAKTSMFATAQWLGVLTLGVWWWSREILPARNAGLPLSPPSVAPNAMTLLQLITNVACLLVVVGLIDYFRAWFVHLGQMRMSRAELAAELRETEGDPIVRRRRRQKQMSRILGNWERMLRPEDLILLGHGRLAVAVREGEAGQMTLLAKAVGTVADTLERVARHRGVRVSREDAMARRISEKCAVGDSLPQELVCQVAAWQSRRTITARSRWVPSAGKLNSKLGFAGEPA
jgi:flagellar biosynthetic protein FlhB